MYIKTLIIDGFKSYRHEVILDRFDRHFNAITGSNGSGKSNILDSICFVLGESNVNKARVQSMSQLIYENGRSHVHKATVSIKFDNTNKLESPRGYIDCDEIVVTRQIILDGRCNYLVNGRKMIPKKVSELFSSIQLNIHNPHFLVMQGHITKMINMKPKEIIGLIEESIGTAHCARKSEKCSKTIQKKNERIEQLEELLNDDIVPQMNKLRKNYENSLQLKSIEQQYDDNVKMYDYLTLKVYHDKIDKYDLKLKNERLSLNQKLNILNELSLEIDKITSEINELDSLNSQSKDKEMLDKLTFESNEKKEKFLNQRRKVEEVQYNYEGEEKELSEIEKQIISENNAVKNKEREISDFKETFNHTLELHKKLISDHNEAKQKYEMLTTGVENEASVRQKTLNAQDELSKVTMDLATKKMRLKYLENELTNKRMSSSNINMSFEDIQQEIQQLQPLVDEMKTEIDKQQIIYNQFDEFVLNKKCVIDQINKLDEDVQIFYRKNPFAIFRYIEPKISEFNSNAVKDIVAKLFIAKDPKFLKSLQVAAGGKLYNVVVDDENTSKLILKHCRLPTRYTFIPMQKIQAPVLNRQLINYACCKYEDKIWPALSLIEYDQSLQKAMEFVFGNVFICENLDVATNAAYDPNILRKCITLEGDFVDPKGLMYGGSSTSTSNFLFEIDKILKAEKKVNELTLELKSLDETEQEYKRKQSELNNLQLQYNNKKNRLDTLKMDMSLCDRFKITKEIKDLKIEIVDLEKKQSILTEQVQELTARLNDPNFRNQEITETKKVIDILSNKIDESKKEFECIEKKLNFKQLELDNGKTKVVDLNDQYATKSNVFKNLQIELDNEQKILNEKEKIYLDAKCELDKFLEHIHSKDGNRIKKVMVKTNYEKKYSDIEVDIKELKISIKKLEKEYNTYISKFDKELYAELETDERLLEVVQDLNVENLNSITENISSLQQRKNQLKRSVNIDDVKLYENVMKNHETIQKKRNTLISDRVKLYETIEKLRAKRLEHVESSWKAINENFKSIFQKLLPRGKTKLLPVNNDCILDGFEIKIGFGETWKEDLNEISGGQRSLLALSLLLATLSYKPAPFYILDEIDAALDLSNTENFGEMLKEHFQNSQFLIVSHKNQMFNNANVRFHVSFEDGSSSVNRRSQN